MQTTSATAVPTPKTLVTVTSPRSKGSFGLQRDRAQVGPLVELLIDQVLNPPPSTFRRIPYGTLCQVDDLQLVDGEIKDRSICTTDSSQGHACFLSV